ncbi:transcription antitermination factor NusB [Sphingomonas sp. 7/4-4]|uniref:transcription antitermination factor NusB n=1 Tax=Sphingomonas sp. 7/4-4 TaxID=3018446 RepID=UPI0022F3CAB3|nr:transcription antitermination factor NusB [Sphingomonas sp. 7/4-4]WBY06965.1 transcription antitermination factor NusB [Sphingomonas sp. 7/4-4]
MSKAPNRPRRPSGQEPDGPGVPARRAALKLLDAVLRRGLALEQALDSAASGLAPNDRGLAHAIAAETLRRLPDLDALIDSATQRDLPDDAKARFALRIALVQALVLGTPGHAAISTVLPWSTAGLGNSSTACSARSSGRERACRSLPRFPTRWHCAGTLPGATR